jgi:DNA-binding transcriptional LysR family regulator
VAQQLAVSHPGLRFELQEREPTEVMQLLADDRIDLGFVYDFSLVPRFRDDGGALRFIFAAPLVLAVPTSRTAPAIIDSPQRLASVANLPRVVNSRGDDDGELVEYLCGRRRPSRYRAQGRQFGAHPGVRSRRSRDGARTGVGAGARGRTPCADVHRRPATADICGNPTGP